MRVRRCWMLTILCMPALLAACATPTVGNTSGNTSGTNSTSASGPQGYTPAQMRAAYGVTSLYNKGDRGQGQTVVVIESYGSPTLQQDMNTFCQQVGLPAIQLDILHPLGTVPFDPSNQDMIGWTDETSEDVELIHAIAPDAKIVVLTSPVDEVEGTSGLPQFLQLEQYAVANHLGNIISQSWGASEYTLTSSAAQQLVGQFDAFYHQATTQDGITFFASSGDSGATDAANSPSNSSGIQYRNAPTSSFPNDDPWVTSAGGTTLDISNTGSVTETAWGTVDQGASSGGFSAFFPEPSYQRSLPASVQSELNNRRGLPDVAADANPTTGMIGYDSSDRVDTSGGWFMTSGTSAASPTWAALTAIADQVAGQPLGFLNDSLYAIAGSNKYGQDFRDITSGNNTYDVGGVSVQGYNAAPGWDPVTGLGAPIADHLIPDLIADSSAQARG